MQTHIAGIPHRKPDLSKLTVGEEVRLVPEPDNKFDPNAIRVFVKASTDLPVHLGYIPKDKTSAFKTLPFCYITQIAPLNKWSEVIISTDLP